MVTTKARVVIRHVLVYGMALLILMPFFWVVLSSFKSPSELVRYPPTILPTEWTLENFTGFFRATNFQRAMWNSAMVAFATTVISMVVAAPAAYALSRFTHRSFEWIARFFIYSYMIPPILLVLPVFQIFFNLGLANNLFALVFIYLAIVMPLILWTMRSFFAGIPIDLEEAAMVDGATRFRAFLVIVLPQAYPGLIATGIIAMNIGWSEYLFAATLLTQPDMLTISPRLESFMGRGLFNWGWLMAAAVAVTAPLIVVATLLQKRLVEGFAAGAIKG
ncbi:MAG: carbohydrate ABC transporter permease [Nitriliruptoraceae bacterium]